MAKYIINADDFGQTLSCTRAIAEAMESGLITDTTMVANGAEEAFLLAAELAVGSDVLRGRVGIHLNLTEGEPLTEAIRNEPRFVKGGAFHGQIKRLRPLSGAERRAVHAELTAQLKRLREAGIPLSHADSHHHIHTAVFIAPTVLRACREDGIPKLRLHRNVGVISPLKRIVKAVYNKAIGRRFRTADFFGSADDMAAHTADGITEIMVHPDYNAGGELIDRRGHADGYPIGPLLREAVGAYTKDTTTYEAL